jgi:chemotaxis protein methyltransferase CheR
MTLPPARKPAATPAVGTGHALHREFEFLPGDFDRIRRLIHQKAGIALSDLKQDMVYSRLARRVRATGAASFAAYLDRLERTGGAEWEQFINSLTTNLTSFFREAHHFPLLADYLKRRSGRPARIWCCAASTGEEPYSIAMTVHEALGGNASGVAVIASDIDTGVLSVARAGQYGADRVERLDADRLRRFFTESPAAVGKTYTIRPELRRQVDFRQINLLDANWSLGGAVDVIFCRNVMIYFDKATQYRVLAGFSKVLAADGLLFAGHSESFLHASDLFRSLGKTVYQPLGGARGS